MKRFTDTDKLIEFIYNNNEGGNLWVEIKYDDLLSFISTNSIEVEEIKPESIGWTLGAGCSRCIYWESENHPLCESCGNDDNDKHINFTPKDYPKLSDISAIYIKRGA